MKHLNAAKIIKLIVGNIAVLVVVIMLIEIIARAIMYQPPFQGWSPTGQYGNLTANQADMLIPSGWPQRSYWIETNQAGLRNLEDVDPSHQKIRVLALGDSFTFGVYLANYDSWPAQLEQMLNRVFENKGRQFEVLNAGIPGYTIEDHWTYLQEKGFDLNPDVIIIATSYTDVTDYTARNRAIYRRAAQTVTSEKKVKSFIKTLAVYELFSAINLKFHIWRTGQDDRPFEEKRRANPAPPVPEAVVVEANILYQPDTTDPYWQAYLASFTQITGQAARHHIPVVVVAIPDPRQLYDLEQYPPTYQTFLAQHAALVGYSFVDLLPLFKQECTLDSCYLMFYDPAGQNLIPDSHWAGNAHTSAYGNFLIATALADYFSLNPFSKSF
jgi:hypothetical protein